MKYTETQRRLLEDVAAAYPSAIRYKGTIEKSLAALERDGLVTSQFDVMLDALHRGRSRRIFIVKATEKLMKLRGGEPHENPSWPTDGRPERILSRFKPCRCGCHGKDPRHKRYFERVVRHQIQYPKPRAVETSSGNYDAIGEGIALMPWGPHIVYRVVWLAQDNSVGKDLDMGWYLSLR